MIEKLLLIAVMFVPLLYASTTPVIDNKPPIMQFGMGGGGGAGAGGGGSSFVSFAATTSKMHRTRDFDIEMVQKYLVYCAINHIKASVASLRSFVQTNAGLKEQYEPQLWEDLMEEDWDYKVKVLLDAADNLRIIAVEPPDHLPEKARDPKVISPEQAKAFVDSGIDPLDIEGLPEVKLKDLGVEHVDKFIELETCKIVGLSDKEPFAEKTRFYCKQCTWHDEFSSNSILKKKPRCEHYPESHKVVEDPDYQVQHLVDSQIIKLQELSTTRGHPPALKTARFKGEDIMWSVKANERIKPKGFFRLEQYKDSKTGRYRYRDWFEIEHIKKVDHETDIQLSDDDIRMIEDEMAQPQFYEKLLASYCPHIIGMDTFKEAALLAVASIKLPRPIRILLVSDPSLGKSDILEYTADVAPNAHYITMANTRYTGLTTTSEKDEQTGRWTVRFGLLPAAHNGLVCIDEFQVGSEQDIGKLNDVVERGKVRYTAAGEGNYGEVDASCAIIIACNPHEGRIVADTPIYELLKFMGKRSNAFLSRMTLTLIMRDNTTVEEARRVAKHIYKHGAGNDKKALERYEQDYELDEEDGIKYFGKQTIRKILHYVVNHIEVEEMPAEFEDMLVEYYIKNRTDVTSLINRLVNHRYMRHVIVLCQVIARIKGQTKPNGTDIQHALDLFEKHMYAAAFDPETGEIDPNPLNDNLSRRDLDKMTKDDQLIEAIKKAELEEDGKSKKAYFTTEDVVFTLRMMPNSKWKSESEIERAITQMHHYGKLMERGGQGRWIYLD